MSIHGLQTAVVGLNGHSPRESEYIELSSRSTNIAYIKLEDRRAANSDLQRQSVTLTKARDHDASGKWRSPSLGFSKTYLLPELTRISYNGSRLGALRQLFRIVDLGVSPRRAVQPESPC